MPKLTLSVDEKVVRSAKCYAASQGTSVSRLVESYLDLLARPFDIAEAQPVLRMVRGAARGVPADAHASIWLASTDEAAAARSQHSSGRDPRSSAGC